MTKAIKAEEYFYAATLEKKGASATWNPASYEPEQRLQLRQLLLGHKAKENEYNVVEVEAPSVNGTIKIPIAVLKIGEQRVVQSNLEFPEGPVSFRLIEGSGPVYIHGQHIPPDTNNDAVEEELLEDEDFDEEEIEQPAKRQKLSDNSKSNNTINK